MSRPFELESSPEPVARERVKIWTRIGACLLTGTALSLASGGSAHLLKAGAASQHASSLTQLAQGHGGEGGEGGEGGVGGEGGEGGKGASASLSEDDVAYLTQLGLVRGHLNVGVDLYRHGDREGAEVHMKHPADELYADLVPALEARGSEGFATELETLATLVESGAPLGEVEAAHDAVLAKIEEVAAGAGPTELDTRFQVILQLVRTAADEYAIGVKDGEVVNDKESIRTRSASSAWRRPCSRT